MKVDFLPDAGSIKNVVTSTKMKQQILSTMSFMKKPDAEIRRIGRESPYLRWIAEPSL
jgi:hypothetical protein